MFENDGQIDKKIVWHSVARLTSVFITPIYLTIVEAFSSRIERRLAVHDDCKPAVISSILLSNNGEDITLSISIFLGVVFRVERENTNFLLK